MKGNGQTIEESIRIEAYLLSEKAGHPPHKERVFWKQAEEIVLARAKQAAGAKSASTKTAAVKPKTVAKGKSASTVPAVKAVKSPAAKAKPAAVTADLPLEAGKPAASPTAAKAASKRLPKTK